MATKGRKVLAMKVPSFSSRSPTTVLALMMLFMQTCAAATACQLYLVRPRSPGMQLCAQLALPSSVAPAARGNCRDEKAHHMESA